MKRLPRNNFIYLLIGLLFLLVLIPALRLWLGADAPSEQMRPYMLAAFSFFTLISMWSLYQDGALFRFGLGIAVLDIGLASIAVAFPHHGIEIASGLSIIAFSVLSCYTAGRHVFSFRDTDANSLIGAVCVYLLLGLIWAMAYRMLGFIWQPGAFQGMDVGGQPAHFDACLYFSFVTLTTAGYGDITPLNPIVRTVAYLEMIAGQFYMAILVSGLVAHFMGLRMSSK